MVGYLNLVTNSSQEPTKVGSLMGAIVDLGT